MDTIHTDALAAKIMRAKNRGDAGTFSDVGRAARDGRIEGLIDAWEMFTNEEGTEANLRRAEKRHNKTLAAQAAREAHEGIAATDVVTVGKAKGEWVVQHVDVRTALILSPSGRTNKREPVENLTLVRKGSRHTDFYRG